MEEERKNHLRMMALCRRMGDLWAEENVTELDAEIPQNAKQESKLLLYGKLFSKPNVKF